MSQEKQSIPVTDTQRPCLVGVHLTDATVRLGVVDAQGRSISRLSMPAAADNGPDSTILRIGQAVRDAIGNAGLEPAAVLRLGIAVPDLTRWDGFPLRERLADRCGMPVTLAQDIDAAAYGEFWVGAGRGFHSLVLLALDAEIACGIIVDETAANGEINHGGQCGHILIDSTPGARLCRCGQRGHLAAYASETAVLDRVREELGSARPTSLRDRLANGDSLSADLLAQEAQGGDPLSREIVAETAQLLAVGIATVMHTVDPSGVLLCGAATFGGSQTAIGREFLHSVREEVSRRAFPVLAQRTVVDFTALADDAAWIGAAGLARRDQSPLAPLRETGRE